MKNCKKCMKNCKNCISTTSCWTATLLNFADKRVDQWTYQMASTYSDYVVLQHQAVVLGKGTLH
jgi:hypothetical protein